MTIANLIMSDFDLWLENTLLLSYTYLIQIKIICIFCYNLCSYWKFKQNWYACLKPNLIFPRTCAAQLVSNTILASFFFILSSLDTKLVSMVLRYGRYCPIPSTKLKIGNDRPKMSSILVNTIDGPTVCKLCSLGLLL